MVKKLRARRGETLVETLAAILIVVLSSVVLLTMTMSSVKINRAACQSDEDFRGEIAAVERQTGTAKMEVRVGTYKYEVTRYGAEGGLTAYGLGAGT